MEGETDKKVSLLKFTFYLGYQKESSTTGVGPTTLIKAIRTVLHVGFPS